VSGEEIALCAASSARCSPLAMPVPISAMPIPVMMVRTSAKSTFTSPGMVMRSLMPCTAWRSTSSAMRKASKRGVPRSTKLSSRSLGMVMRVSTQLRSSSTPRSAVLHAPPAFEAERLGHHRHGQGADLRRQGGDDGHRAVARAAAEAGGQEDHVGPFEALEDVVRVLQGGLAAHFRIGAGAEALGEHASELDADRRAALGQRLKVRIGGDELDAPELGVDHAVHRVVCRRPRRRSP